MDMNNRPYKIVGWELLEQYICSDYRNFTFIGEQPLKDIKDINGLTCLDSEFLDSGDQYFTGFERIVGLTIEFLDGLQEPIPGDKQSTKTKCLRETQGKPQEAIINDKEGFDFFNIPCWNIGGNDWCIAEFNKEKDVYKAMSFYENHKRNTGTVPIEKEIPMPSGQTTRRRTLLTN